MVCFAEAVVANHVCYSVPVSVTHSELCCASGCESRCAMLSHWLGIIVSFAEPVVVNHC